MQVACPHCDHCIEYSDDVPHFCAFCGKALAAQHGHATAEYSPDAVTQIPAGDGTTPKTDVAREIGGYRLLRSIGVGGMGTVYEAEDAASGRRVALKLISPEYATSKSALERFRQEGRLASMVSHPRCVFVLAADEEAGQPYIAMELMSGSTLQDLVPGHAAFRLA
jgi:serine/threonine protein kinase